MKYRELEQKGTKLSSIGLGCMGMSFAYGEPDNVESIATLRNSLELGINFWDTADIYGNGANEELLSQVKESFKIEKSNIENMILISLAIIINIILIYYFSKLLDRK